MSYATIAELAQDATFQGRVKSCATIECQQNLGNPDHPDWSNLAYDTLRGADHVMDAFIRLVAQAPGLADNAGFPLDQTKITDAGITKAVNDNYPVVASLWYNPDGTPWNGAVNWPAPP